MPKNRSYDPDEELENEDIKGQSVDTSPHNEELMQQLELAQQKTNEHWERILRMQAEAENASRRSEREVANAHKYAIDKFVAELIPIVDSLELCVNAESSDNPANASIVEGVNMTLKMFYSAMEKFGIQQINPLGQAYEPEFQQAISVQEDGNVKPNTVISVLQKGYTLNSRLVRPALVVVSKA